MSWKRIKESSLLFLVLLVIFPLAFQTRAAAAAAKARQSEALAPAALAPFLPPKVDELAWVEVKPGLWVAAYSFRDRESVPHSRIIAVGPEAAADQAKLLWKSEEAELYNPIVKLWPSLTYQGQAIILVTRQRGAAWAQMDAVGFQDRRPLLLDTQEAELFETAPLSPGAGPQLLAYKRRYVSMIPEILAWDGRKFVPASQKYPQYYEALVQKGGNLQDTDFKPLEMALLTALAGRRAEARQQMEKVLSAQKALGAKANRQLLKAVQQELSKLQGAP